MTEKTTTSLKFTSNFDQKKRKISKIKFLIFHYTGMVCEKKAINRLCDQNSKVSCHYFIKKNGEIILMVPEKYEAWHAGISAWKKDVYLNKSSIGIEISNKGHRFGYENYSKNQINSLKELNNIDIYDILVSCGHNLTWDQVYYLSLEDLNWFRGDNGKKYFFSNINEKRTLNVYEYNIVLTWYQKLVELFELQVEF